MGAQSVLLLTKKKALGSIGPRTPRSCASRYEFCAINYESMHKLPKINWDLIILDEAHALGAFPKASKRAKAVRDLVRNRYVILLSGTPTPESYSQMYHQVYGIPTNPFRGYKNFYSVLRRLRRRSGAHHQRSEGEVLRQGLAVYP